MRSTPYLQIPVLLLIFFGLWGISVAVSSVQEHETSTPAGYVEHNYADFQDKVAEADREQYEEHKAGTSIPFAAGAQAMPVRACLADLEFLPSFLLENDAGGEHHLVQRGESALDDALEQARAEVGFIRSSEECVPILNEYLSNWRHGHLGILNVGASPLDLESSQGGDEPATSSPRGPELELLSDQTAFLTLGSFENRYQVPLANLLEEEREALANRSNWIIDVRDNVGGNDGTYGPLLPWLLSGEIRSISQDWLATPANIRAHEGICEQLAPDDPACESTIEQIVAILTDAGSGDFVAVDDREADGIAYYREERLHSDRPQRVAVLVGGQCGSACENFLLSIRQSFSVKLLGRASYGALDYSNMRPVPLPSGERTLWYATTRSSLLPGYSGGSKKGFSPRLMPLIRPGLPPRNPRAGKFSNSSRTTSSATTPVSRTR